MAASPGMWQRLKAWFNTRVSEPFIDYLKQDSDPKILARSASIGFCLGLCPIVGVSAGLCIFVVFVSRGRLHGPMTLLANLVAMPVEVLLIFPFMRLGEVILRAPPVHVVPKHFRDILHPGEALRGVGHALLAWAIIAALLAWPLALALTPLFSYFRKKLMLRRVDSNMGATLIDCQSDGSRDSLLGSDLEMGRGSSAPTSPVSQRAGILSPRNSSALPESRLSPHI